MSENPLKFQLNLKIQSLDMILDVWDQADGMGLSARMTGNPGMVIRFRDVLAQTFGRFAPAFASYLVERSVLSAIPDHVPFPGHPHIADHGWIRFEITDQHAVVTMKNLTVEQVDAWFKPFAVST